MYLTNFQKKKIEKFAKDYYSNLDFAHNLKHMNKTIKLAEFIAKKEKANIEIVKVGALLHQFHNDISILKKFLNKIKLKNSDISKLLEFARFRPFKKLGKMKDVSLEAKCVFDADALQVIGPYGIIREICCNIKARNKNFDKSVEDSRLTEKNFYNSLQTKTARNLAKKSSKIMIAFWKDYDYTEKL